MPLPTYRNDLPLEEALKQFDYASSNLALNTSLDAATDAFNSSSRWIGALERMERGLEDVSPTEIISEAERYLLDTEACMGVLDRMRDRYSHQEKREKDSKHIRQIKREKAIVKNYLSLMRQRRQNAREIIRRYSESDLQ